MAILVTRPEPDNHATAAKLQARGYNVLLAPLLRFETLPLDLGDDDEFSGIVVTSANALRAVRPLPVPLLHAPLFTVGDRTAAVARDDGFRNVISAQGDAHALRDLVASRADTGHAPLLYLAGENVSSDLPAQLAQSGIAVVTRTVYRMAAVHALQDDVRRAMANGDVTAVLHYSRASAAAFVAAVRAAGFEISALALPQVCLSDRIAQYLRETGATRLAVADTPDEEALLKALAWIEPGV